MDTGKTLEAKVGEKCVMCDGTGTVYDPHCSFPECSTAFTEGQMSWIYARPAKLLPCGHRFKYLREQLPCPDCQGRGTREE